MGCDIYWSGNQEARALQEKCRELLKRIADALALEHDLYRGNVRANIIDESREWDERYKRKWGATAFFSNIKDDNENKSGREVRAKKYRPAYSKEFDLNGIRIFPLGRDFARESISFGQISFVFDNSNAGEIVTLRDIEDPLLIKHFSDTYSKQYNAQLPTYQISNGGNWRALGEANTLIVLLAIIRQLYVPSLTYSDDYCISEKVNEKLREDKLDIPSDPAERERYMSKYVEYLKEKLPWHRERASYSLYPKYWPVWCDYCKKLKGSAVRSISELAEHCSSEDRAQYGSVALEALLFLDSMTIQVLEEAGFRTVGDILSKGELATAKIDETPGATDKSSHLGESIGFLIEVLWKDLTAEERSRLMIESHRET